MRRLVSKSFLIFALATLTACSNGNALNAQCESAISARDNFSAEVNRLWEIEIAETRAFNEPIYSKYSECLEDPDTFIRTNTPLGFKFASCERWRDYYDHEPRNTDEINNNFIKMYMVVSNNQSCFTPEEVVEAQLKLKP
jgi:hypothetical protein